MKEEEIQTLQSAVELDRIHNEGKLFRALQGGHISKEEMIASIFSIVQKKNAQNETQKLLSNIASSNGGSIGDFWDMEGVNLKDRILNSLLFNTEGNFNIDNLKRLALGVLGAGTFVMALGYVGTLRLKKRIKNRSMKKSIANREAIDAKLQRDEKFERIRAQYKERLGFLNQFLENENISDEDKERHEGEKEKIENILTNSEKYASKIGDKQ